MTKQAQKSGDHSKNIQVSGDLYVNHSYLYEQVKEVAFEVMDCENNEAVLHSDSLQTIKNIQKKIYIISGVKVMLDKDLADLYGVGTRALNQSVRRNRDRFPPDFLIEISKQELDVLEVGRGKKSTGRGGRRKSTLAFTEGGVAMLSSVLRSKTAIQVNIDIMRAFVSFKSATANDKKIYGHLRQLEKKYELHDTQFKIVFDMMRDVLASSSKTNLLPPKADKPM
jgi:hypothetical protein